MSAISNVDLSKGLSNHDSLGNIRFSRFILLREVKQGCALSSFCVARTRVNIRGTVTVRASAYNRVYKIATRHKMAARPQHSTLRN